MHTLSHYAPLVLSMVSAMVCAATMGFAIQRGGTCAVAAVDEVLTQRRATRLLALVEASFWVLAGLLGLRLLGYEPVMPVGYAWGYQTIVGAALLGFGALLNGACIFGAVARFGSGQWAYAATPLGFYLGCAAAPLVPSFMAPVRLASAAPALGAPAWAVLLMLAFLLWRGLQPWVGARTGKASRSGATRLRGPRSWSPHGATVVIGITFLLLLCFNDAWTYTDALAELARGMASSQVMRLILFVALLTGAVWGGWTAGVFSHTALSMGQVLRCMAGGFLMGLGSLWIPGGNDGLILLGMPLLWPYAWLAFITMCATVAAGLWPKSRAAPGRRAQ